ncbi:ABC transporter permease [Brevibacterium spongiae]|uniref:ABC transporter permease n=1 Tax=Brevibacterium spongiae TaxID=2909672 RepID=A0ABY5SQN4_9MICO|nr:ABC transporter permease [Brevibacterium spongiae]UVI36509.1 ABC transporter permease [Brevibacterium spongiae]
MSTTTRAPKTSAPRWISAEWAKFRDLRRPRRLLITALVLGVGTAVLLILTIPATRGTALTDTGTEDVLSAGVLGVDAAAAVLVVLAAWFAGAEFRTGAITEALLRTRGRGHIVTAKTLVIAVASAVTAVVTAVAVTLCGIVLAGTVAGADGKEVLEVAFGPDHLRLALGGALLPVIFSVLAVFGAVAFRSVAGGVLTPLALLSGSMVAGWLPDGPASLIRPLLPLGAVHNVSGIAEAGGTEYVGVLPALLVLIVWVVGGAMLATWRLRRQDF